MWYSQSGRKTAPGKYYVCRGKNTRTCAAGMSRAEAVEGQVLDLLRALTLPGNWREEVLERAARLIDAPRPRTISASMVKEQLKRLALVYTRGDIDAATEAIAAFSRFGAARVDTLASLEINPLIVGPRGPTGVDFLFEAFSAPSPENRP